VGTNHREDEAVDAQPVATYHVLVDVEGRVLVLELLDEVPQHERGDRRIRAGEEVVASVDEHLADRQRHGLEASRVGEVEVEVPGAAKTPVVPLEQGFVLTKVFVSPARASNSSLKRRCCLS
jgi:hypothetical protein